jgi:methyltransferase-like protein
MFNIVRDMMLYHTREVVDPHERAIKARTLLGFLADALPDKSDAYASFLNMYARRINGEHDNTHPGGDALLLHDELEEVNHPVYFYQFVDQAERHGLQYLADAEFHTMVDSHLPVDVSTTLREMVQSAVEMEQYLDFLQHRSFRNTLLCHAEVSLNRMIAPKRLMSLCAASRATPVDPEMDIRSTSVDQFRGSDGTILSTDHPVTKAAMLHLNEVWPQAVSFDTLLEAARARLAASSGADWQSALQIDAHALGTSLLKGFSYSRHLMKLHIHAPHVTCQVGERPIASPVARLQAQDNAIVTSLCHERVRLDEFNRYLLLHLDGEHDRAALLESVLAGPMAGGILKLQENGEPVEDEEKARRLLVDVLERNLHGLARAGLLDG